MTSNDVSLWNQVGNTDMYSTGHYLVTISEVKAMFQDDVFDNGENLSRLEHNMVIASPLDGDRRVLFYFFPFKIDEKYIMEGNASREILNDIDQMLPHLLKKILSDKARVTFT